MHIRSHYSKKYSVKKERIMITIITASTNRGSENPDHQETFVNFPIRQRKIRFVTGIKML